MDSVNSLVSVFGRNRIRQGLIRLSLLLCIPLSVLSVEAMAAVEIILKPTVTTVTGETVIVLGDKAELSSWNKAAGLPCTKSATTSEWTCQPFSLAAGTSYQYKYAKRNSSGVVTYESISNRSRTAPSATTIYLETWNVSGGTAVTPASSSQSSSVGSSSKSSVVSSSIQSSSAAVASSSRSSAASSSLQSSSAAVVSSSKSSVASSSIQSSSVALVSSSKSSVASSSLASSSIQSSVLSSSSTPVAIQIILKPTVTTAAGETVIVLGDKAELSSWNKAAGLPCTKSATSSEWTCQAFTLAAGTSYLYKYAKRNSSGVVTYESISNRSRTAPTATTIYLETWNVSGGTAVAPSSSSQSSSVAVASSSKSSVASSSIQSSSVAVASSSRSSSSSSSSAVFSSSSIASVLAVPAQISVQVKESAVDLSWSSSPGATHYEVQRNSGPLASVTGLTYSDIYVPGGVYIYRVRACAGSSCSLWKESASTSVPPSLPLSMIARLKGTGAEVTWGVSRGATSYELQRDGLPILNFNGIGTSFTDTNIQSGKKYLYRVRGCIGLICSGWQATDGLLHARQTIILLHGDIAIPIVITTPEAPAAVSVAMNLANTGALVSWPLSVDATHYQIKRDGVLLGTTQASFQSAFSDTTVVRGASYTYSVRACTNSSCSDWKVSALATIPPLEPTAPTTSATSSAVTLGWAAVPGATRYEVSRNGITLSSGANVGYVDNSITYGAAYTYGLRACIGSVCSAWNTLSSVDVPVPKPSSVSVIAQSGPLMSVSWAGPSGATSYKVIRNGSEAYVGTTPNFLDSAIAPTTSYTYGVSACFATACSEYVYAAAKTSSAAPVVASSSSASSSAPNPNALKAKAVVTAGPNYKVDISWQEGSEGVNAGSFQVKRFGTLISNGSSTEGCNTINGRGSPSWGMYDCATNFIPGNTYVYTILACIGTNGCQFTTMGNITVTIPTVDSDVTAVAQNPSAPSALAATLNMPSKLGLPSSGLKLTNSEDGTTEIVVMNRPNNSGVSYNKFDAFEANKPIKIINTSSDIAPAKLIIVEAKTINLNNSIEIVGETADILFITNQWMGTLSCLTCSFNNFGRVTLANALSDVGPFTSQVGQLRAIFDVQVNNLSAPGITSLELIASNVKTFGEINTLHRANFNTYGGYDLADNGNLIVGAGSVNLYSGDFNLNYDTLSVNKVSQSASLKYISANIKSAGIRITAASPLVINGNLSTKSDILMSSVYRNQLVSAKEGIEINNIPQTKRDPVNADVALTNMNGTIYVNGSLKSDFDIKLNLAGNLYFNGDVDAKDLQSVAIGNVLNTSKATIKVTSASIVGNRIENNGAIHGSKIDIAAVADLQNRFGGKIFGDSISLISSNSVVRNGSLYPFKQKEELDAELMYLPAAMLKSHAVDSAGLSSLSTMTLSDFANSSGSSPVADLSAKIIGREINVKTKIFENINPYYSKIKGADGFIFDSRVVDRVLLIANESLKIEAANYALNSSAIMGVNQPSVDRKFIVSSPNINNERYLTRVQADIVDSVTNQVIPTENITTTTTTTSKNLVTSLSIYSPPGVIYSFAAMNFNFPGTANTRGFVNNTSYFEALSHVYFTSTADVHVKTIGLMLETEAYETKKTVLTQIKNCSVYDGSRYIYVGNCTNVGTTTGNNPGETVANDEQQTLFSVLGNTYGNSDDGGNTSLAHFDSMIHQTLDDIKAGIFQNLANSKLDTTSSVWRPTGATYTVVGDVLTIKANYTTKSGSGQVSTSTYTYSVWEEIKKGLVALKAQLLQWWSSL